MADLDQILMNESGRISPDIYRKSIGKSPWTTLVQQAEWPDEMGAQISVMTYDRSLPGTTPSWSSVGFNTGSGNTCAPSAAVITPAQTLRTYNLAQSALESAPLCVNDVRNSLQFKKQLTAIFAMLTQNTEYHWQNRYRDEYTRLAEHKVIAHTSALPEDDSAFPLIPATSRLTQGILDRYYLQIQRETNNDENYGMINGQPQYALITSAETSRSIIKTNSDIRNDFQFAFSQQGEASPLLKPLGVKFSYSGFYHVIDQFVARWEFTNGAWVRVEPFTTQATTNGTKYIINPSYLSATFEDSIIFMPNVYKSLVPKSLTNPGGNVEFDPQMYRGDWKWLNVKNTDSTSPTYNPDGNWGFFRGVMQNASEPLVPEVGYVIRHLRCDAPLNLITCS